MPDHPAPLQFTGLSIVIPVYNECDSLEVLISDIRQSLASSPLPHEIIFVDDNSEDGTAEKLDQLRDHEVQVLHRHYTRGLASAVVEGASWARYSHVLVMDGDGQHAPSDIPHLIKALTQSSAQLVIGSRFLTTHQQSTHTGLRQGMSQLANALASLFIVRKVTDPMTGFFLVEKQMLAAHARALHKTGFKILFDLLYHVRKEPNLVVKEVQIHFLERTHGASKLNLSVEMDFMADLISKSLGGVLEPSLIKFCAVGASGVLVHLGFFYSAFGLLGTPFRVRKASDCAMKSV